MASDAPTHRTRATQRLLELVEPPPADPDTSAGYLDLSTPGQGRHTGAFQALMFTETIPAIYERWWRPVLGRVLKGSAGPSTAEEYRLARSLLELQAGDLVLDVACGPGNLTRELAACAAAGSGGGGLVVGIDASPTMLARAVGDNRPAGHVVEDTLTYVRGDAIALPFRRASFDAVCCFAGLHLFADPWTALDHMARIIKPGGRIALLTSYPHPFPPVRRVEMVVGRAAGFTIFGRDEIVRGLRQRGFENVARRAFGFAQLVSASRLASTPEA